MKSVKIEPTVTEDKKIFVSGEFEVSYDYPNDVFVVKPCEEKGGKIVKDLTENFYLRRNIMPKYELSYEKVNQIIFTTDGENVAPAIRRLMENGEEEVINGIATHLIEMISSKYAIINNENGINYDNEYRYKKSSKLRKSASFREEKLNTQEESIRTIVEKFYTQEELDKFRKENFKDLEYYSNIKNRRKKEK